VSQHTHAKDPGNLWGRSLKEHVGRTKYASSTNLLNGLLEGKRFLSLKEEK
jgi:hypothetical protein